ncbi:3-isopropylmalate dehydratase large subunit [Methanosarcinales archaeon]|nr:MAG: 3-isopropylmalate dehydratase large subunit [Methanosarcinales archaeon]
MGKTMAEKILSRKCGRDVEPGELVVCEVDMTFAHDGTMPLAIQQMKSELGTTKVFDSSKVAGFCDHASPSPSSHISNVHTMMREFARENCIDFYENGDGICHQIVLERYAAPYKVIVGADSHTCTHGVVGAFATGMGSTDVGAIMVYGKTWFKVPESMKIEVDGELGEWVTSKDLFLSVVGDIKADGATYMSMEFLGKCIDDMEVEQRATLTNMAIEAGAKLGLCKADEKVEKFLTEYGREDEFEELYPDDDAEYLTEIFIDAQDIEPMIAYPHRVDNVAPAYEFKGMHIDQVCIGSCTNGRLSDLEIAAQILDGEEVCKDTRLVVYPASRSVFIKAVGRGIIEKLLEAGAAVCAPGCGFCIGRTVALGDGEKALSTQNRNFKGRMGNENAEIYLSSVPTAAASALYGEIVDPREVL